MVERGANQCQLHFNQGHPLRAKRLQDVEACLVRIRPFLVVEQQSAPVGILLEEYHMARHLSVDGEEHIIGRIFGFQ